MLDLVGFSTSWEACSEVSGLPAGLTASGNEGESASLRFTGEALRRSSLGVGPSERSGSFSRSLLTIEAKSCWSREWRAGCAWLSLRNSLACGVLLLMLTVRRFTKKLKPVEMAGS